jgi:membrane-associated phospholipid phosphatase
VSTAAGAPVRRKAWGRREYLLTAAAGLIVLALCGLAARNGTVSSAEESVFHAINDLPQWLYRPMWVFQQFGNLVVAFMIILVVAIALRKPRLAVAAVAAVVLKLSLERVVKQVVERQRPGASIGDVVLRGDVSSRGLSFVSGHAVIMTAAAMILTPYLPRRWKWLPWAFAALNGIARVYVGAHNPLDVIGGAGLGLAIGGVINAALVPGPRPPAEADDPLVPVDAGSAV